MALIQPNQLAATVEKTANKATNLSSPDDTKYPTTLAVDTALSGKQNTIPSGSTLPTSGMVAGDLFLLISP